MADLQTIQIFLPSGDPQGLRVAEITTSMISVIEVPRSLLAEFLKRWEAKQVGVYYLVGPSEEGDGYRLYIGQSGNVGSRLAQHDAYHKADRDFWTRALIVVSRANSFNQAHALFLEWLGITNAKEVGRYGLANVNVPERPHVSEPLKAECENFQNAARILLTTLGYPFFEKVGKYRTEKNEEFYCRSKRGAEARGLYTPEGFVVLRGSRCHELAAQRIARQRKRLIAESVLRVDQGQVVFTKDHLFKKPSPAAEVILGRSANGWTVWKNAADQTLDEVCRKGVSTVTG